MPPMPEESPYRDDDASWQSIEALAREPDPISALLRLTALVLGESRAERAFVAALDDCGRVVRAWGVDIDGLAIAQPEERIDAESVEHRFATGVFDHVRSSTCSRRQFRVARRPAISRRSSDGARGCAAPRARAARRRDRYRSPCRRDRRDVSSDYVAVSDFGERRRPRRSRRRSEHRRRGLREHGLRAPGRLGRHAGVDRQSRRSHDPLSAHPPTDPRRRSP